MSVGSVWDACFKQRIPIGLGILKGGGGEGSNDLRKLEDTWEIQNFGNQLHAFPKTREDVKILY